MLASVATLKRLSSDVQTLAYQAEHRISSGFDDPHDAARVASEEYRPLLNGEDDEAAEEETGSTPGKPLPVRVRKLELACTYAAFFVLGSMILLPWNAIIVAQTYFAARLSDSPYAYSFASWTAMTFMLGNLVHLAHATYTQQSGRPLLRIFGSIACIAAVLFVLCLSTRPDEIDPSVFFFSLLVVVWIAAAGASYLQNAVVALSARFGPQYLQGILGGQGFIAFAVSVVQLLTAVGTADTTTFALVAGELDSYAEVVRKTAFIFFLIATGLAAFAFACHMVLVKLPFYRLTVRSTEAKEDDGKGGEAEPVSMRAVERKVRVLGLAILFVFLVTLSVFPAVTASILSVHTPSTAEGLSFFSPTIFIPVHFVVFNGGDWLGRSLPSVKALRFKSTRKLVVCSLVRVVFIPLFLGCNVTGVPAGHKTWINSDALYLLILFVFATSNGFVSTLIMISGVELPTLEKAEVDLAATVLAFYLTSGLAVGSLASFGVRGAARGNGGITYTVQHACITVPFTYAVFLSSAGLGGALGPFGVTAALRTNIYRIAKAS